ncbi:MAG: efflux RND transporter permease subunit [Balneolaceae bacterium]
MQITEFSLRRPVTSLMVFISLVVVGLIAARQLPLEFFPDISFPGAFIQVPYNDSTPEEIEKNITRPVEEVLATLSGLERMNSNSGENNAGIFIQFSMGTDMDMKALEIREKIDGIRHLLPADLERYFVNRFSAQDEPLLNLRISSDRDLSDAFDLLNRNLKLRLERINGVGRIDLYGVDKKQIRIDLLADRLVAHNVNINELSQQLQRSNFSLSAGKISDGSIRYSVRPVGELQNAEEIGNLLIGNGNLRLKDIAEVTYREPPREYGRHLDRKYAIGLDVFKESGANTVEVTSLVLEEIDEITKIRDMQGIQIYELNNQADGILSSLWDLFSAGAIGALFSILVLYMFLRRVSTTLIVALAVPFSLIVTLGFLYFLGLSLNILSMMGLMLAIGMLVDNAVVVTENIHRNQILGKDTFTASVLGVKQVGMAVTAGTLTTIIVFLPNIVSEQSMIAVQLYHVAISIIIALTASLLISLTIIPLLTSRIRFSQKTVREETWVDKMVEYYGRLLGWLMRHKRTASVCVVLTVASVVIPSRFVDFDMFPRIDEREMYLSYHLNDAYVLERVKESVDRIENYLYENQEEFEIESVYSFYTSESATSTIILKDEKESEKSVSEIRDAIAENLPKIATGTPSFEFRNQNISEEVRVFLIGESTEILEQLADETVRLLSRIDGFADVTSESEGGREEIRVMVDRDRANRYDLSSTQLAQMVSGAMRGQNMRRVRSEEGEIDVVLAFQGGDRQSIDDLMGLTVLLQEDGEQIKLSTLTDYEIQKGPRSIVRENRQTSLGVRINLEDITADEARTSIAEVMDRMNYPSGYGWSYGRSFQQDQETMDEMLINMLLALALIYLVMAALFESILYPASIITSVFFAIIGVFWFFMITGTTFSFMAMIGILILMGIVVNNGIVLIDHINHLRGTGMNRFDSIVQGGRDRVRPILMTAATTILGLVPLCLGTTQIGGDGPPYFPMARAIVGGLLFSTVITLVILPTIYVLLDDMKRWSKKVIRTAKT